MSPKRDETFGLDEAREFLRSASALTDPANRQEYFRQMAESLREPITTLPEPASLPPSEEARAMAHVRQGVERLSEITAALLDLEVEQRAAFDKSVRSADRSAKVIIGLTVVLAVLTYVLAAEALHWWPFG